jgi:hypothetical protein
LGVPEASGNSVKRICDQEDAIGFPSVSVGTGTGFFIDERTGFAPDIFLRKNHRLLKTLFSCLIATVDKNKQCM